MKNIYIQAWNDYLELVDLVNGFKGSLDQLCERLNGFNKEHLINKFDCYFKSLTATIEVVGDNFFVYDFLDVWDDEHESQVEDSINYADLKTLAEQEIYKSVTELMKTARGNKKLQQSLADIIDYQEIIDDTPTADVQEVKHGEWVNGKCSECGKEHLYRASGNYFAMSYCVDISRYCPHCGAKMDGVNNG